MKTVALFCGSSMPHNKVQPCNATPHLCAVKMQKRNNRLNGNNKHRQTMNDIIKQLCNTDELVEIYTNPMDSDKFGVAYIVACSDEHFLLHSFQENDLDDGYYVDCIDSVMRIQRNTIYLNNMLQFIKPKTGKYQLPKGYWPDLNLFGAVLSLCQEKQLVAQVAVNHEYNKFGWIKSFNDDVLEMDCLDCDGMFDGTTYLRMENINMVGFGGVDEERRAKLFHNRTHQK